MTSAKGTNKVVITGMGVLAPNGKTLEEFWNANIVTTSIETNQNRTTR